MPLCTHCKQQQKPIRHMKHKHHKGTQKTTARTTHDRRDKGESAGGNLCLRLWAQQATTETSAIMMHICLKNSTKAQANGPKARNERHSSLSTSDFCAVRGRSPRAPAGTYHNSSKLMRQFGSLRANSHAINTPTQRARMQYSLVIRANDDERRGIDSEQPTSTPSHLNEAQDTMSDGSGPGPE